MFQNYISLLSSKVNLKDNSKHNMQVILELSKCYMENQQNLTPFDAEGFYESKKEFLNFKEMKMK
jgi:hypothetical protein